MSTEINPAFIIDDNTPINAPQIGGMGHGLVDRPVEQFPVYGASPVEIKTYPRENWPAMLEESERKQSNLFHLRNRCGPNGGPMPYLVQGQWGYCWAHSATHAIMLQRAAQNQPYVALSAFSLAARIMNGRNEGAWAALAFDHAMKGGVAPQSLWPQGNANPRLWTSQCQVEAAKFTISEGWWDAGKHPGLRKLTVDQVFTLLWDLVPCPVEFSWWDHSVLGLRFVDRKDRSDPKDLGRYDLDILNSHQGYGDNGVGRLSGNRKIPDSSVGLTVASAA